MQARMVDAIQKLSETELGILVFHLRDIEILQKANEDEEDHFVLDLNAVDTPELNKIYSIISRIQYASNVKRELFF